MKHAREYPKSDLFTSASYQIGYSYFLIEQYEKSISYLEKDLNQIESENDRWKMRQLVGFNYLKQMRWNDAFRLFDSLASISPDEESKSNALMLKRYAEEGRHLPHKNLLIAGALSAIIPGTGKIYCGRYADGIYSLLLIIGTGSFAYKSFHKDGIDSAKGWAFGTLSGIFYVGNIYGSAVSAQIYNRQTEDKFLEKISLEIPVRFYKMKRKTYIEYCLLSLYALLLPLFAHASSAVPIGPSKVAPRLHWKTLETYHFSIHFHQGEEELASRTAFLAERIYARLTQSMQCLPNGKTQIVINDSIDIVNGVATPALYNQIFIYPTQPVLGLGHFEDWLESLLIHEYTHILDIGGVDGFAKGVQSILGKLWFPKLFVSSLFTEGYAVYNETHYTDGGRGRDPYTDMFLRESFLADDVPALDKLLFWGIYPGGNHPYTYGGAFFRFMGDKYSDNSPRNFQRYLASGIWPWNADNAALVSTMRPLNWLWEEWKYESIQRYRQQKSVIQQQGITVSQPLTASKSFKWNPIWSATGESIYYFSARTMNLTSIR